MINRLAAGIVAAATGFALLAVPAAASADAAQSTVVSALPSTATPFVDNGVVYAIGKSSSTVVLGGSFTSVSPYGSSSTQTANYLTAFDSGTGALISGFAPSVNGTVHSVIAGPTAGTVYVGGDFTTIDGVSSHIGLISTATGALVPGWKSPAINGSVNTLVLSGSQLFVGGVFTSVSNVSHVGLAVVNATTGALSSFTTPAFTGHHNYNRLCTGTGCADAPTGIKNMDINPAGTRLIAIGNFNTAGGLPRDQIALVDLSATAATVDPSWNTAAYSAECAGNAFDVYVRDVQFSPDGSYFVVVATGGGAGSRNSDGTLNSCDATARYETSTIGADVRPTWIDYTGNDSLYSVAVTGTAIYAGGHFRWLNNSMASDTAGEGSVPRPGIAAMDPQNGMPLAWNPGRNPRGAGAWSLLATSDGLYVGSDTDYIGDFKYLRKEIAFFPLAGGYSLASNSAASLPGSVFLLGSSTGSSTARQVQWDGSSAPGTPTALTSVNWSTVKGAFEINHEVYYASTDGNFYMRSFDGTTFGPAVAIDPYDDPTWENVSTGSGQTYRGVKSNFYNEMSSLTSMFYSNGRVYYTRSGSTQMFWRWFEPDSGVIGSDEFTTTDSNNWSHVAGAFLSGSTLYYADSTTKSLMQVAFTGGQASGPVTVANSAIDWTSAGAFVGQGATTPPANQPPVAALTGNCSGLTCTFNASGSHDPDGTITNYAYTWGDGTSTASGPSTPTHVYASAGPETVTVTVTDNDNATGTASVSVDPTTATSSPITFGGATTVDALGTSQKIAVPASTKVGDTLLLMESWASPTATSPAPAGWNQVGATSVNKNLTSAVYSKTAQAADLGSSLTVSFSDSVKASLAIADYANVSGIESSAISTDATTATHKSPTLTGLSVGTVALTYWTDKSTGTTAWTPPAAVTQRTSVFGTGGGAVSALVADSGSPVSGSYGGLTATTNATSGLGTVWTIALAGS